MTKRKAMAAFHNALTCEHGAWPKNEKFERGLAIALEKDGWKELTIENIDALVMGDHYEPAEGGWQEYRAAAWLLKKYPNVDKVLNDYCS